MHEIYIETVGTGDINLALLHGWGFNHTIWYEWSSSLSEKFTCYLIDLPGSGRSAFISDEKWFEQLHKKLPKNINILGWSLGGLYALKYAELYTHEVNNVYLLATSPYFVAQNSWPGIAYEALKTFYQQLKLNPENTLNSFIGLNTKGLIPKSWQYIMPNVNALKNGVECLINWDLRYLLQQLPNKIYLVLGRFDKIVPSELLNILNNQYPRVSTNLLMKTGHMPFLTHQKWLTNWLLDSI